MRHSTVQAIQARQAPALSPRHRIADTLGRKLAAKSNSKVLGQISLDPREKPKGLVSSDMLSPSAGALFADVLTPGSFGGARAGRAETIASSMGQDVPTSVSAPRRHLAVSSLAGAGLGAVTGLLISRLSGGGGEGEGEEGSSELSKRLALGAALGGSLGALGGAGYSTFNRGSKLNRIARDFDEYDGPISPTVRKGDILGFSPSHARGREEAFRALLGGDRRMQGSTSDNILSLLPGGGVPRAVLSPFLVQNANEGMSEASRRDGAYGFQPRMEKF